MILKQCLHRFIDTEEKIVESPTTDTDKKHSNILSQKSTLIFINPSLLQESDTSIESSNNPPINAAGNK